MQKKRIFGAVEWTLLIGAIGASVLLLSYITLYSDDYQYATYFYGGLRGFWDKTVEHYLTVNGRALIHFFAEVFLIFGTKLYAIVFPFMMAFSFFLAHKVQNENTRQFSPLAVAVSLCLFLALPVVYLNQTFLWIAGSFNYCFPALLVFAYFAAEQRALAGRGILLSCLLGFFAGATTEQNGLMALVGGSLIAIIGILRAPRKKRPFRSLCSVLFVLAGYLSVMLSPGTFSRVSFDGEDVGLLSVILNPELLAQRFYSVMAYFCGTDRAMPGAAFLLTVLILFLSFLPVIRHSKKLRPLMIGLPVAVSYLMLLFFGNGKLTAGILQFIVCGYLAFAGVLLLFEREFSTSGVFLIAGLASIGIMIFTNLGAYRTVVPTLIMLIAVIVRLFEVYFERVPQLWQVVIGVVVIMLCALAALPTFRGYRANSVVAEQNEAAIAEGLKTGEITLCTDYLDTYRHTLMFEGGYFFTQFRLCYGIPSDMPVHLEGEHFAHWPVVMDEITFRNHAMMTNSVLYLPMRELIEFYGASFVWDFERGTGFYINRGGEQYYLSRIDNTIKRLSDGEVVTDECYTIGATDRDYMEIHAAADFFGFTYTFDWQTVTVSPEVVNK